MKKLLLGALLLSIAGSVLSIKAAQSSSSYFSHDVGMLVFMKSLEKLYRIDKQLPHLKLMEITTGKLDEAGKTVFYELLTDLGWLLNCKLQAIEGSQIDPSRKAHLIEFFSKYKGEISKISDISYKIKFIDRITGKLDKEGIASFNSIVFALRLALASRLEKIGTNASPAKKLFKDKDEEIESIERNLANIKFIERTSGCLDEQGISAFRSILNALISLLSTQLSDLGATQAELLNAQQSAR